MNDVVKSPTYYASYMRFGGQILVIILEWFHEIIHDRGACIHINIHVVFCKYSFFWNKLKITTIYIFYFRLHCFWRTLVTLTWPLNKRLSINFRLFYHCTYLNWQKQIHQRRQRPAANIPCIFRTGRISKYIHKRVQQEQALLIAPRNVYIEIGKHQTSSFL